MASNVQDILKDVNILGPLNPKTSKILSKDATVFLALLHRTFNKTRKALLERRLIRQAELDRGVLPDFLPQTKHIRDDDTWTAAIPAPGLVDRRVEITGPTDRKMVVNALNADVWTYMADFEGELCPAIDEVLSLIWPRLERANMGQHDQRPSQLARCDY